MVFGTAHDQSRAIEIVAGPREVCVQLFAHRRIRQARLPVFRRVDEVDIDAAQRLRHVLDWPNLHPTKSSEIATQRWPNLNSDP